MRGFFSDRCRVTISSALVLLFTFLAVPIPVAAASSARAPINLNVRNTGGYIVDICIRSKNDPVQTEDRFCVWNLTVNETEDMPLDDEGVGVLLDFWVDLGPHTRGTTSPDATGATGPAGAERQDAV